MESIIDTKYSMVIELLFAAPQRASCRESEGLPSLDPNSAPGPAFSVAPHHHYSRLSFLKCSQPPETIWLRMMWTQSSSAPQMRWTNHPSIGSAGRRLNQNSLAVVGRSRIFLWIWSPKTAARTPGMLPRLRPLAGCASGLSGASCGIQPIGGQRLELRSIVTWVHSSLPLFFRSSRIQNRHPPLRKYSLCSRTCQTLPSAPAKRSIWGVRRQIFETACRDLWLRFLDQSSSNY